MFSLFKALQKRQHTGSNAELKTILDKETQHNLVAGRSVDSSFFVSRELIESVAKGNFVATFGFDQKLALHDISRGCKLWEIPVDGRYVSASPVQVSSDGVVVLKVQDDHDDIFISIYQYGVKTGSIACNTKIDFIHHGGDRIYGISGADSVILIWSLDGKLVESIPIIYNKSSLASSRSHKFNDEYFVAVSKNLETYSLFVYSFETQQYYIHDIAIDGSFLVSTYLGSDSLVFKLNESQQLNPEVVILNLRTRKDEKIRLPDCIARQPSSQLGGVTSFIESVESHGDYVVFKIHNKINSTLEVYCLDRRIENDFVKIKASLSGDVRFTFQGNHLLLWHSGGNRRLFDEVVPSRVMDIIDLASPSAILKTYKYICDNGKDVYRDGKLLVQDTIKDCSHTLRDFNFQPRNELDENESSHKRLLEEKDDDFERIVRPRVARRQ